MNTTVALLVKLLPEAAQPYLKFIVTVLGGAVSAALVTYPHADPRYAIASAALTALVTYLTPNIQPVGLLSSVAEQAVPEAVQYINTLTPGLGGSGGDGGGGLVPIAPADPAGPQPPVEVGV